MNVQSANNTGYQNYPAFPVQLFHFQRIVLEFAYKACTTRVFADKSSYRSNQAFVQQIVYCFE